MSTPEQRHPRLNRQRRRHIERNAHKYLVRNTGWHTILQLLRFLRFKRLEKWVFRKRRPVHRVYHMDTGRFSHCLTHQTKAEGRAVHEILRNRRT